MALKKTVGAQHGVSIEVAAWDGAGADVELSCVAMFSREVGGNAPQGGLAHVDTALNGRLLDLRKDGYFTARLGETALISTPPPSIAATALLIVGAGDPSVWSPPALAQTVNAAANMALALRATSVAFAPSMLDSGVMPEQTQNAPAFMVQGLIAALKLNARLEVLGLAPDSLLKRWAFDVGEARFEHAAAQFEAEVKALREA